MPMMTKTELKAFVQQQIDSGVESLHESVRRFVEESLDVFNDGNNAETGKMFQQLLKHMGVLQTEVFNLAGKSRPI